MDSIAGARARIGPLDRDAGPLARDLTLGLATIRILGLTESVAAMLADRWGGFLAPAGPSTPSLVVRSVVGDGDGWLPHWKPGERYRLEADAAGGSVVAVSYHFALAEEGERAWRVAATESPTEPLGRVYENAMRYLVARIAAERGGFALHGAGVLRGDRAWIFGGVSGSGKSTAVRHSAPAASLGDDFAVAVFEGGGWKTCALPFDNSEHAPARPIAGLLPLALISRLYKASRHRLEHPDPAIAPASLLACAAFPWALPDLADRVAEAMTRATADGKFAHLHAANDPGFWKVLEGAEQ